MPLSPPVNGTEQRLDILLAQQAELIGELQGLRAEVRALKPPEPEREAETLQLREPKVMEPPPKPKLKPKRKS